MDMDNQQPTNQEFQAQQVSEARPIERATDHKDFQTFIPTKNMPALLSYYAGVFGFIPFLGLPATIAALVLGRIGIRKAKANPTPGAKGHAIAGLVMGTLQMIVFILFLAFILMQG